MILADRGMAMTVGGLLAFGLALILSSGAAAQSEDDRLIGYYGLEMRSGSDAHTVAFVNGVPAAEKRPGESGLDSVAIHGLVRPGENELTVMIGTPEFPPLAGSGTATKVGPSLSVKAILQRDVVRELGAVQETTVENLGEIQFDGASALAEAVARGEPGLALPTRVELQWRAPATHPSPPWDRGTPMQPETARVSALVRLDDLRRLLSQGDVDGFVAASFAKYQHVAAVFPLRGSADQIANQDAAELRRLLAIPGFAMTPIDPMTTCPVYAGNRLLECLAPDGEPALRGSVEGAPPMTFQVMFASIGGELRVVR